MDWIKNAKPESYALYDLSNDIGQQHDLSAVMAKKVSELSLKMKAMWDDLQAEAPFWPEWKAK